MNVSNLLVNKEAWIRTHRKYFPKELNLESVTDEQLCALQAVRFVNPSVAQLCQLFGFGWIYAGKIGYQLCQWIACLLTVGIIWSFVDIFRIPRYVKNELNVQKLHKALQMGVNPNLFNIGVNVSGIK